MYFRCGYVMIYGQMPAVPGLDAFYRRNGFDVLDVGDELDMWVVFGVHSRIRTAQVSNSSSGRHLQLVDKVNQPLHLRPAWAAAGPRTSPLCSG